MDNALRIAKDNNIAAMLAHVRASNALQAAELTDNRARLSSDVWARRLHTRIELAAAMAAERAAMAEWRAAMAVKAALEGGAS